jgi:hypothetical protein
MKAIRTLVRTLTAVALVILVVSTGCKKNSEKTNDATDNFEQAAGDAEQADMVGSDAENIADVSVKTGASNMRLPGSVMGEFLGVCATVTKDSNKVTVDFGTSNCLCKDGRNRRGKILVTWTGGGYWITGSVKTVTFDGYYVNDHHVEGTRSVTNNGANINGNMNWTINAQNMRITRTDGKYHEWNSLRNRELIAGDTAQILDDKYSITGSWSGDNSNGETYSITITNPIIRAVSCWWIQQGTVEIVRSGKPMITLDYGNGTCDNEATITHNGKTKAIKLH